MAKSMKVPVLIFEHIQEASILLEGLHKVLSKTEASSSKESRIIILVEELEKIIKIMEKTNIR